MILTAETKKSIADTLITLLTNPDSIDKLVTIIKTAGVRTLNACNVLEAFITILNNPKSTPESKLNVLQCSIKLCLTIGSPCEPYLVQSLLPTIMERFADKNVSVRKEAESAAQSILKITNQDAVRHLLFMLFQGN